MKPNRPVFCGIWRAACTVSHISKTSADRMVRSHYIGKWPSICVLSLALRRNGRALGVVVFSLPPRETAKRYGGETWELARLWIDDTVPQNGETYLIGRAVRYIKRNHPTVKVLVSYADPSAGHVGTIYKAANWKADGRTDSERKNPRSDYVDVQTGLKYSRRSRVPEGAVLKRVPRVSKYRFVYHI